MKQNQQEQEQQNQTKGVRHDVTSAKLLLVRDALRHNPATPDYTVDSHGCSKPQRQLEQH